MGGKKREENIAEFPQKKEPRRLGIGRDKGRNLMSLKRLAEGGGSYGERESKEMIELGEKAFRKRERPSLRSTAG